MRFPGQLLYGPNLSKLLGFSVFQNKLGIKNLTASTCYIKIVTLPLSNLCTFFKKRFGNWGLIIRIEARECEHLPSPFSHIEAPFAFRS